MNDETEWPYALMAYRKKAHLEWTYGRACKEFFHHIEHCEKCNPFTQGPAMCELGVTFNRQCLELEKKIDIHKRVEPHVYQVTLSRE